MIVFPKCTYHRNIWKYVYKSYFHRRVEPKTFLFGEGLLSTAPYCSLDLNRMLKYNVLFFDNKDIFVGSFYYSTCKFDRANVGFNRTRRFETSHHYCHQERFQTFITTPIGATSMYFVVQRDLQNSGSTCGSLLKSFWRHDIWNTQLHLNCIAPDWYSLWSLARECSAPRT